MKQRQATLSPTHPLALMKSRENEFSASLARGIKMTRIWIPENYGFPIAIEHNDSVTELTTE